MIEAQVPVGGRLGMDLTLFGFEYDFAGELKCIPMLTQLKLERCGIKLSLKQWSRFAFDDRHDLASMPCESPNDREVYTDLVVALIERSGDKPSRFHADVNPQWEQEIGPPAQVHNFAVGAGIAPPSPEAWARLSPAQRFVLIKLTRPGGTNTNLPLAMTEFGLDPYPVRAREQLETV